MGVWALPVASSADASGAMGMTWNGPAAIAMCCADVGTGCEKTKMTLFELWGWATWCR